MKTMVVMKRQFANSDISQRSDNGYFSATDLIKVGNLWRLNHGLPFFNLNEFLRRKSTEEFIDSLKNSGIDPKINSKGKNSHTWVHPFLFIDIALIINPEFKIEVYSWIYDSLIKYRNDSGDKYKKMAGALYLTIENKSNFKQEIMDIASRIKSECQVIDWQTATEDQLKLRDKIQEYISVFSDIIRDRPALLEVSIKKAKSEMEAKKNELYQ